MNIHSIAGVVFLCAATLVSGTTLDDKVKSFEDAVKATPVAKTDSAAGMWPRGCGATLDDLDQELRHSDNEGRVEALVSQLMTTHPSDTVRQTGEDVILVLEAQRKVRSQAFTTKAIAVLSEVQDAVTHAKTPADLDGILKDLHVLQDQQNSTSGYMASAELGNKIPSTFQFVTKWQDYLAAAAAGNWREAQLALRSILDNREIDAPMYFPRSEILARYADASHGGVKPPGPAPETAGTDPDVVLVKITTPDEVEPALPALQRVGTIPGQEPWDWSELWTLAKARDDSQAGITVFLDLKKAMNWQDWGDNISRITAMELLAILPHYFGTDTSDPPKANETVAAYLDRLSESANSAGNLALLQRVIAVQVALATANGGSAEGTQQFLAGLSQDAAGQYAPAVVSYENALKDPDRFLPFMIVGERLAAIKAAHPDEFNTGLTSFLTPAPINPYLRPGMPPWTQPGMARPLGYPGSNQVYVLPIPTTIPIPSQVTAPPAAAGNAAPVSNQK